MPQIAFNNGGDLKKLIGCLIEDVRTEITNGDPALVLKLSNPGAEKDIGLRVISGVTFGRSGNVMLVNGSLTFHPFDIEKKDANNT